MVYFSGPICKLGINLVIDPPDEVLRSIFEQAGRDKGPIAVRGAIGGAGFVQTLVKHSGKWRLYVNGEMLRASGLKAGDTAEIEIAYDPRPREVPMVAELKAALAADEAARAAFDALAPSRRTDILRYLDSLKTPAAIERNVAKILGQLRNS